MGGLKLVLTLYFGYLACLSRVENLLLDLNLLAQQALLGRHLSLEVLRLRLKLLVSTQQIGLGGFEVGPQLLALGLAGLQLFSQLFHLLRSELRFLLHFGDLSLQADL